MSQEENVLVIVDGYSSGSYLPKIMKEHQWKCIHVRSAVNTPPYFRDMFNANDYLEEFVFKGHIEKLREKIKPFNPAAVLPGTESGVILADQLAHALGLQGNNPKTSLIRRDKYEMHEAIKKANLLSVDHYQTNRFHELLEWSEKGEWPVVLKPVASAGTDSVRFCKDINELKEGFKKIHGSVNQLGEVNTTVLSQRFMQGQEYFVNGVSKAGGSIITEVWQTHKILVPGAGMIYDKSILFDPEDEKVKHITNYVYNVLKALGIQYGAHHSEIIETQKGPTLVECAARLSGGLNRGATNYAIGISQLDLLVKIIVESDQPMDQFLVQKPLLKHPLWQVQLISKQDGKVIGSKVETLKKKVKSKIWIQRFPEVGTMVSKTVDLFTSPGLLFMSHENEDVLKEDFKTIRNFENRGELFIVSPMSHQ